MSYPGPVSRYVSVNIVTGTLHGLLIASNGLQVDEDQLERAKTTLKTNLMLSLDDTSQVAEDIGRQVSKPTQMRSRR